MIGGRTTVQNHILVNATDETFIIFGGYSKRGEIIGNRLQCKMVASFLFENNGDKVFFVASDWHFGAEYSWIDQNYVVTHYKDVTKELLQSMVEEEDIECPLNTHLRCPNCPHPELCPELDEWFK